MGRDKALIPVGKRPLVLHVARLLGQVADPVFVAPGRPGRLGSLGYPEVADEPPRAGPGGGMVAGLTASPHELLAVVAVDMPFANPVLFRLLAGFRIDQDAVVARSRSGPEPLHAVYARSALPALRSALARGELAVQEILSRLRVRWVVEDEWREADPTGRFSVNLNRDEDLALLEGIGG
jgi:molybdopterin-guanine dinucleotide biosynthesis protein A